MISVKANVEPTEDQMRIHSEVIAIRKMLKVYDTMTEKVRSSRIILGERLIELQKLFIKIHKSKKAGFMVWAGQQFNRAPSTIENCMWAAKNPEAAEQQRATEKARATQDPLNRAKNAFLRLDRVRRIEYLTWLDQYLKEERLGERKEPRSMGQSAHRGEGASI